MHNNLTRFALTLGVLAAWFAYKATERVESQFSGTGFNLGYPPEQMTWWPVHYGHISCVLFGAAFAIEIAATFAKPNNSLQNDDVRKRKVDTETPAIPANGDADLKKQEDGDANG